MIKIVGPALVLRKFDVRTAAGKEEEPVVEIEGRKPGILGWLLMTLGIDASTRLIVTRRDVTWRSGSLFGEMSSMIPMTAVASAHGGHAKPVHILIIGGAILLITMFVGIVSVSTDAGAVGCVFAGIGLLAVAGCLVYYWLEKRMAVFVESSGGAIFGVVFKRSIIEGVPVDIDKVNSVVAIVRELVIACQQARTS